MKDYARLVREARRDGVRRTLNCAELSTFREFRRVEEILHGGGGRGEKLSPFFAFIFPLFPQKRLILTLNFPIRRLCISQFHLRPAPTPGLMRGICLPCQSRGWGICNFCTARGLGICQPSGHSRVFDTHAVSYQNTTTQKVLLEKKSRLAHLSRAGINFRGL